MVRVEGRGYGKFVAGFAAGALAAVLYEALRPRRGFDHTLLGAHDDTPVPPVVIVPGILGSQLLDARGRETWLGLGNMVGAHAIALPAQLPLEEARDGLVPGGLLGVDHILPRLFGFSEYGDLVSVLERAGFVRNSPGGRSYSVYAYDWRRDLAESARGLGRYLERLAHERGTPDARFTVIGHSMGGLVARLHLRFGSDDPTGPVTWGGAPRVARLVVATAPNGGSLPALEALLNGAPVGFSTTTLAASVCATFPSLYALLPPPAAHPLLDGTGAPLAIDLLNPAAWEQHGWGAFAAGRSPDLREYARAALFRARDVRGGLDRAPQAPCPVPVALLGGDTLPTLAHGVLNGRGVPRFVPENPRETALLYEAGDGRVTRASLLASHVETAHDDADDCGVQEASRLAFGDGDHHGLFAEPGVQSALLRAVVTRRGVVGGRPLR
ncbi:MAG: hypothetical protein NDJ94_17635 [Vicinamibacteria bacterium]|nr:hypothetical protein [Vicinamibacteria bacterium]